MKTNAIIRMIIWSLALVILLGILMAGLSWDAISTILLPGRQETSADSGQALPNEEVLQISGDTIREIEIEWVAGDIIIQPADIQEIKVSESAVTDEKETLVWSVKGETLEIFFCKDRSFTMVGINSKDYVSKDLYISVPQDWECDLLKIETASANLEVSNLTIREMDFDGARGTCDFNDCNVKDLDIDTASGDITFSGTLETLDFDAASASFIGQFRNTPHRIDMDGMSGNLDIALPENCGFTVSMDGMSSSFRSDFQGTENRNDVHVYGDGRCSIQVDGMSCDVTIRKLENGFTQAENP